MLTQNYHTMLELGVISETTNILTVVDHLLHIDFHQDVLAIVDLVVDCPNITNRYKKNKYSKNPYPLRNRIIINEVAELGIMRFLNRYGFLLLSHDSWEGGLLCVGKSRISQHPFSPLILTLVMG